MMTPPPIRTPIVAACLMACACSARADEPEPPRSRLDRVQITATRFAEQVQEVPQAISVVTGQELRDRGANDLRTALSLIGGITVAPGGDQGPAGSVPGLMGLREVDDLLLLVDGIPAGGAFLPSFDTVSLNNIERIEVLRGSAPVYFGTTAFAGTINIVHYAAGKADSSVSLNYGSFGSIGVAGAAVISDGKDSGVRQSISAEIASNAFADPHTSVRRAQAQYRAATEWGGGTLRLDLNAQHQRQRPDSPTPVNAEGKLVSSLSPDFNQNPFDAHIDKTGWQLTLGYDKSLPIGQWGTTAAVTRKRTSSVRGFLDDGFEDATGTNATGFSQDLRTTEVFFDTHLTSKLLDTVSLTYGLNELYGRATQSSQRFAYNVPLSGAAPDSSTAGIAGEAATLADTRSFFGAYAQAKWQVAPKLTLLGGLRWNQTHERRDTGDPNQPEDAKSQTQNQSRFSGTLGANWTVWSDPSGDFDDVALHAGIGNTFQPPQIDFGPDAGGSLLLKPETMRHVEFGVKADGFDGRLDLDLTAFIADFRNQPMTAQVNGAPALVPAGNQRFEGVELEGSFQLLPTLTVTAHASHNDARYRNFSTSIDGNPVQLAGKRRPMSPDTLAGVGLVYAPTRGWRGSLVVNHVGSRYLDMQNTHRFDAYAVADASIGYAFDRLTLTLTANNLGNRRDPALASELGEGQVYRLPGRRLALVARFSL